MPFINKSNAKRVLVFVIVIAPGVSIYEMSKSIHASRFGPGNAIAKKHQESEKGRNGDSKASNATITKASQLRVPF